MSKNDSSSRLYHGSPYISKLESISSSAVRAADKVGASLIVVYTHTGELCAVQLSFLSIYLSMGCIGCWQDPVVNKTYRARRVQE